MVSQHTAHRNHFSRFNRSSFRIYRSKSFKTRLQSESLFEEIFCFKLEITVSFSFSNSAGHLALDDLSCCVGYLALDDLGRCAGYLALDDLGRCAGDLTLGDLNDCAGDLTLDDLGHCAGHMIQS
ncbi:hypothetical protein BgiMline_022269 [Biomphalaria glabrata]